MSPTPLTDELEHSIPENAELCEWYHEMQKLAHRVEQDLTSANSRAAALSAYTTSVNGSYEYAMRENRALDESLRVKCDRVDELKRLLNDARVFLKLAANHCPDNAVDFKYSDGEQGIKTQGLRTTINKLVEKIESQ